MTQKEALGILLHVNACYQVAPPSPKLYTDRMVNEALDTLWQEVLKVRKIRLLIRRAGSYAFDPENGREWISYIEDILKGKKNV